MTIFRSAKTGAGHRLLNARPPASVCGPRGEIRPLTIDSLQWKVFEYADTRDIEPSVSLMFSCDAMWRRLRAFPADWREMDDAMLTDLGAHK
jgi:hypothetical protein